MVAARVGWVVVTAQKDSLTFLKQGGADNHYFIHALSDLLTLSGFILTLG